jgi:hypothetical protein
MVLGQGFRLIFTGLDSFLSNFVRRLSKSGLGSFDRRT